MSNGADGPSYVIGILVGAIAASIIWWATTIVKEDPLADCEAMALEIWAFDQCLKYQPACMMPDGQESFVHYYKIRDTHKAMCAKKRGDADQSQSKQ